MPKKLGRDELEGKRAAVERINAALAERARRSEEAFAAEIERRMREGRLGGARDEADADDDAAAGPLASASPGGAASSS